MGFWSSLLKIAAPVASIAAAPFTGGTSLLGLTGTAAKVAQLGAAGLGAVANTSASNRSTNADYDLKQQEQQQNQQRDYWSALNNFYNAQMQREKTNSTARADNVRQLQQAEYIANNTANYTPKNGLPSYGFGPHAATSNEIAGANTLKDEIMARMGKDAVPEFQAPTAPTPFTIDPKYRSAGTWEKIAGLASPFLAAAGTGADPTKKRTTVPGSAPSYYGGVA